MIMDVRDRIILSAEELFYLAKIDNGSYLDYDYIAAMGDIEHQKKVKEQDCLIALEKKGLLDEDFDGNRIIDASGKSLLKPIYGGDFESTVTVYDGTSESTTLRFHRADGNWTLCSPFEGNFSVEQIQENEMLGLVCDKLSDLSDQADQPSLDPEEIRSIVVIKAIDLEAKSSVVNTYYEKAGNIYEETENGFAFLSKKDFLSRVERIIRGV